jgi:uncharacterized SAM-binding protein YcdF (DUF218 family)
MKFLVVVVVMLMFGIGTGILFAAGYKLHEPVLQAVGDYLIVQDTLHRADLIHVIAGPDYRTYYALHLYRQGLGSRLFFTGGWCNVHHDFHGERGKRLSLEMGIPENDVALDDTPVTSTYDEAVRLREFIEESGHTIRSVIVVSDPHHMRRARWTYHHVLGDQVEVQMAPVRFELTPYIHEWWKDPITRRYVLDEYKKLVYYFFRYRLSWDWLASLDRE